MAFVDDVGGAPNAAGAGVVGVATTAGADVVVGVTGGVEVSAVVGVLAVAPARFAVEEVVAGPATGGSLGALVISKLSVESSPPLSSVPSIV